LGVAYVEEGVALREAGVGVPILVLGGAVTRQIPLFLEHDLTFTAPSIDKLRQIDEAAGAVGVRARAHLKIDTGMERIGVHHQNADRFFGAAAECASVDVVGVFSHFANADAEDLSDARRQLERFLTAVEFFPSHGLPTPIRHMANSGAVAQLPEAFLDLVRPGILTFGVYPSAETDHTIDVEPVLSWVSEVIYFKVVPPNSPVSYGSTWSPTEQTRVITLPVGYADGYGRALSNRAEVLVGCQRLPVVGRVCMDQTMVDLGAGTAYNGDEVVLIGESGSDRITVENVARWADTIPYEVLTSISARVPRTYLS
ncbi:MAG: alanine racemase, partial [Actinomycetota bacterium]|nr:alanine racemase [Actinomycetota bacterium]